MTFRINNLLRVSLIGALAAATIPAIPTIAFADGNADYCTSTVFAGYVDADDIGGTCTGSRTYFDEACGTASPLVFVVADHRNGVVYVDCPLV